MYAELSITSNFTFLTGASHPEEYMERAVTLGLPAIAIADDNSVAGIVRAHTQAREIARKVRERRAWEEQNTPIGPPRPDHIPKPPSFPVHAVPRLIPAARLIFADAPPVTALPLNRQGWASLCRLLSTGRLRAAKGECILHLSDLLEFSDGLHLLRWRGRLGRLGRLRSRCVDSRRRPGELALMEHERAADHLERGPALCGHFVALANGAGHVDETACDDSPAIAQLGFEFPARMDACDGHGLLHKKGREKSPP